MRLRVLIIMASAFSFLSCVFSSKGPSPRESFFDHIEKMTSGGKIMFGHQDDLLYGHAWKLEEDGKDYLKSDIKEVCGLYPAVYGMDLGGIETGGRSNIDNNRFEFMRESALAHYKRGGVITFSWHPRNPLTKGDAWDVSSKETVASVLPEGANHELFKNWLSKAADFLSSIKTKDGAAIPVIFRPWHEHTGSWFWWGKDLCTSEEYKALWKMTYDYMEKERGLANLIWAYSPGAEGLTSEILTERYPGDDMVDLVGFDCYQYDSKEKYISDMKRALDVVKTFGQQRGKLMAVTETGYEGVKDKQWWTGVLYPLIKEYPLAYVLVWRNACDKEEHFYAPYPGHESAEDFKAFSKLDRMAFL